MIRGRVGLVLVVNKHSTKIAWICRQREALVKRSQNWWTVTPEDLCLARGKTKWRQGYAGDRPRGLHLDMTSATRGHQSQHED